jgi:putative ABC transport system substrate-binding protein
MMRRREFLGVLGGAAMAWPINARAQQNAMPVIGFVKSNNPSAPMMNAFQQGLNEGGYVEHGNVSIVYLSAEGQYDRLPSLLSDLVRQQVSLIVASGGLPTVLQAREATKTIPILFISGLNPVQLGLASSLSSPGGNTTGVNMRGAEMGEKRLEWLLRLLPTVGTVAAVVNPKSTSGMISKIELDGMVEAGRGLGIKLIGLEASTESDLEKVFAAAVQAGAGALSINGDPFFTPRRAQIIALAARHRLPTIYPWREYVEDGGLMSYGPSLSWAYRQLGNYASRILKGAQPSELPVQEPMKFDFLVNLKTAKTLGLTIPKIVLAGATEIIE